MTGKNVFLGGLFAGAVFYITSILTWVAFKFLPIVPLSIAVPSEGLKQGWAIEHLVVSFVIGFLWALGYVIYGMKQPGGWLYGAVMFMVGSFPAFAVHFVLSAPFRGMIFYGAVVSFIGALLGGRIISIIIKK